MFFRSSLKQAADEVDVKGWVRNLADGRVEALLQGSEPDVDKVMEWCHRGPRGAEVDSLEISMARSEDAVYRNFAILR